MNVAVVDAGGYLLAFARMDKAILGSIDIALKKAKTSVLFNNTTEALWEYAKPGGPAPAIPGMGSESIGFHSIHTNSRHSHLGVRQNR